MWTPEDKALLWLMEHKEHAQAEVSWAELCSSVPELHTCVNSDWTRRIWEMLKLRGQLLCRPIRYPEVRGWHDMLAEVKLSPKSPGGNWYYLNEDSHHQMETRVSGSYGGIRGWSDGRGGTCTHDGAGKRIRSHYGATFHHVYARVKPGFTVPSFFDAGKSSLHAVVHTSGHTLVIAQSSRILAQEWIAYLDPGPGLLPLLSVEDRAMVERERAAELAAWGTENDD